jgi:RNA polymerase sigma factor (sigma-70 family)
MMEMALQTEIENLYREESGRLLGYIRNRVKSIEEAEDILQDVFYSALNGISVTDRIDHLVAWFYTAARNKIIDTYRKKKPVSVSVDQEDGLFLKNLLSDPNFHPESRYFRKLIEDAVESAVEDLPEDQRNVFILQELEDMTFREISDLTGESINTLISRKRYAVNSLRKKLDGLKPLLNEIQ